jgi:hypothetical protein
MYLTEIERHNFVESKFLGLLDPLALSGPCQIGKKAKRDKKR